MYLLIGSLAVKYYKSKFNNIKFDFNNYLDNLNDIDYLTDNNDNHEDNNNNLLQNLKNIYNLDMVESKTNQDIINYILNYYNYIHQTININQIQFNLPPIEILLAIYASHIIRIIPYSSSNQSVNISKWYDYLNSYLELRSMVDYKFYDKIFYGNLEDFDNTEQNLLLRKIFTNRFDETIDKFGDTDIDLEAKTSDIFFKDSVLRYIEHDKLHLIINDNKEPIYKKVVSDTNVSLDKNKFDNLTRDEKTEMIKQELIVLIFERNIIMMAMNFCFVNSNNIKSISKSIYHILLDTCSKSLKDIFCHFATNLCGKSHYFLRRYVISHARDFINHEFYNFEMHLKNILNELNIKVEGCENKLDHIINANSEFELWKNYVVNQDTFNILQSLNNIKFTNKDSIDSCNLICGNFSSIGFQNNINSVFNLDHNVINKIYSNLLKNLNSTNNNLLVYNNIDKKDYQPNIIFYFISGDFAGKGFILENILKSSYTIKYFIQNIIMDKNSYVKFLRTDIVNDFILNNSISNNLTSNIVKKELIEKKIKQKTSYKKYYTIKKYNCWCYKSGCTDLGYGHRHQPYEEKYLSNKVPVNKPEIVKSLEYLNYSGSYDNFTELCKIISAKILSVCNFKDDKSFEKVLNEFNKSIDLNEINKDSYESDNSNNSDNSDISYYSYQSY